MTTSRELPIGVLALQGDFAAHRKMLERLGCSVLEVRKPEQLSQVAGLIIPGGESTTLLKLMTGSGMDRAIRDFHEQGKPIFGTCAGIILLASEVTHPSQASLGLIDVTVERNSYGRQIDSFEAQSQYEENGKPISRSLEMVFIRAPRITRVGPGVAVLARCQTDPVLVRSAGILGATFHPEMTGDSSVHQTFIAMCRGQHNAS